MIPYLNQCIHRTHPLEGLEKGLDELVVVLLRVLVDSRDTLVVPGMGFGRLLKVVQTNSSKDRRLGSAFGLAQTHHCLLERNIRQLQRRFGP